MKKFDWEKFSTTLQIQIIVKIIIYFLTLTIPFVATIYTKMNNLETWFYISLITCIVFPIALIIYAIIDNKIRKNKDEIFIIKTLLRMKYENQKFTIRNSATGEIISDTIENDIQKLYRKLNEEELWGNKYKSEEIIKKISKFFDKEVTYKN